MKKKHKIKGLELLDLNNEFTLAQQIKAKQVISEMFGSLDGLSQVSKQGEYLKVLVESDKSLEILALCFKLEGAEYYDIRKYDEIYEILAIQPYGDWVVEVLENFFNLRLSSIMKNLQVSLEMIKNTKVS